MSYKVSPIVTIGLVVAVVGVVCIGLSSRSITKPDNNGQLPAVGTYITHKYIDDKGTSEPFGNLSFTVPANYWVNSDMNCEGTCVASLELLKAHGSDLSSTALWLSIADEQNPLTLDAWIEQHKDSISSDPELTTVEDTTIAGVKAKKYTSLGLVTSIEYYFVRGNYGYSLRHYDTTNTALLSTLLGSLKFTD